MPVKLECLGYRMEKNYEDMLSRFPPILGRYGRTDRRMDRQNYYINIKNHVYTMLP